MAVFSDGGVSFPDFPIFIYSILLLLLAVTLNSLVLYHNYKKRSSLPRTLYMILAIADILVCVTYSVGAAYATYTPKYSNETITCAKEEDDNEIMYET